MRLVIGAALLLAAVACNVDSGWAKYHVHNYRQCVRLYAAAKARADSALVDSLALDGNADRLNCRQYREIP